MINSFNLDKDRFLFFDIFHKNNKLILICPVYSEGINILKLNILCNDIDLKLINKYSEITYEPVEILIYSFKSDKSINKIKVKYNDIIKDYELSHIISVKNNELSLSTLFKNDYNLINLFYNYYIKQGVVNFYMYYNGIISEEIKQKYNLPGITLIEWNFNYWNTNCKFRHHAQLGQINHAIYRYGKEENEYMILCDLDEYMYIPNTSLLKYIKKYNSVDMFGFQNLWSDTIDSSIPDKIPNTVKVSNKLLKFSQRSKCIYKTDSIASVSIHKPKRFLNIPNKSLGHTMLHFYTWSNKVRTFNTENTFSFIQPVVQSMNKSITKPMTKSITKPVAKRVAKPMTKPVAKRVAKRAAKPMTKPVVKPITKQVAKPITKPITKLVAKPITKPITKPVAKPILNQLLINQKKNRF